MENIIAIKGALRQPMSREQYEREYKPHGWNIDETEQPKDERPEVKALTDAKTLSEVKNIVKAAKRTPKRFDDKAFKSEG